MARPTVFLVDDDIVVLATLSKLLNHFGYTTAGASNSEAAMDYVVNAKNRFDVIVTDLAMPDVDGVALLSAAKKIFPEVPIVVVAGHSDRRIADEVLRLGAFAYLAKPLDTRRFVSTIEHALRSSINTLR